MRFMLLPGALAGVMLGLAFIVLHTAGRTLDYATQEMLGFALMLAAVAVAQFLAVRRHPLRGGAAFPPRYFAAMLTSAAAAVVSGVIAWIYFALLDPGYLEYFHQQYLERVQALAATTEEAAQGLAAAERMKGFVTDPFSQAMVQFGTVLMVGLLAAVPVAAFTKPR